MSSRESSATDFPDPDRPLTIISRMLAKIPLIIFSGVMVSNFFFVFANLTVQFVGQ
jgi:hypothetical protein